jgi:hypothetical protein
MGVAGARHRHLTHWEVTCRDSPDNRTSTRGLPRVTMMALSRRSRATGLVPYGLSFVLREASAPSDQNEIRLTPVRRSHPRNDFQVGKLGPSEGNQGDQHGCRSRPRQ